MALGERVRKIKRGDRLRVLGTPRLTDTDLTPLKSMVGCDWYHMCSHLAAGKCFKVTGDSQVVRSEVQPQQQQMDNEGDRDELRKKPFDSWDHRFIDS
uniref:Uncharacterized protein n=1 Tax=Oryza barthii TaxID=65489 RepID=A0A0D3HDJ1_9ORYZ